MIYIEYEVYKTKYKETQSIYDEILTEKERIFQKTQSKAIRYDVEKVSSGTYSNILDNYIVEKDEKRIDERLEEVKSLLDDRERLLKLKEKELRESKALYDKIYRMHYLDRMKPYRISEFIGYSKSQIYRILDKIDKNIKDATKCDK